MRAVKFDVDGIVFDLDGTLTDSIDCYYQVFREAAAQFGISVRREDVLGPMATGSNIWEYAIPKDLEGRDEKIRNVRGVIPGIFKEVLGRAETFREVVGLLKTLEARGIAVGIVTTSWRPALEPLRRDSLLTHFRAVVTHEDGFAPKPAPDGLLECLRQLGVPPHRALFVGDAPADIRAGKAAGTGTIAVLSGVASRDQLVAEDPDAMFENVGCILSALAPA
jgi:phosphoglycolate phosphatase/pyrophosphatase PpaX